MSLRTGSMRILLGCALAASTLVLVASPKAAADDPTSCPWTNDATHALYTWVGGHNDNIWGFATNWTAPVGNLALVPNDDRQGFPTPGYDQNEPGEVADTHNTYVCIPANSTVNIDANTTRFPFLQAIWVGAGSTVNIRPGAGLFVQSENASVASFFAPGTTLNVTAGSLGGRGTLKSQGQMVIRSPLTGGGASTLSTKVDNNETAAGIGGLIVGNSGTMTLPERGVGLRYGYDLTIEGTVRLARDGAATAPGDGFLAAAWGTRTEIAPTGTLDIAADGGYYQGSQPVGVTQLGDLVNNGSLVKSAGSGISVIDADYQGTGSVTVLSGTLALPDGSVGARPRSDVAPSASSTPRTANVAAGRSFATGRCADPIVDPRTGTCVVASGPGDPVSVRYTSSTNGLATGVVLQEDDPGGVVYHGVSGNVIRVGATSDAATAGAPTRLTFTYASSQVGGATIEQLDMLQAPAATNVWRKVPNCSAAGVVPPGVDTCLDRTASSSASGVISAVVLTIVNTDSRYIISRVGAPVDGAAGLGSPKVGDTLDGHLIVFTPVAPNPAPTGYSYTWSSAGTVLPSAGADGARLTLTPGPRRQDDDPRRPGQPSRLGRRTCSHSPWDRSGSAIPRPSSRASRRSARS